MRKVQTTKSQAYLVRSLVLLWAVVQSLLVSAADRFVVFNQQADALPLAGASIVWSDNDYDAVKIAIKSLQADMERVGLPREHGEVTILIGTVGRNAEIDRLKLKELKGLQGCREKFIITTTDHRGLLNPNPSPRKKKTK